MALTQILRVKSEERLLIRFEEQIVVNVDTTDTTDTTQTGGCHAMPAMPAMLRIVIMSLNHIGCG